MMSGATGGNTMNTDFFVEQQGSWQGSKYMQRLFQATTSFSKYAYSDNACTGQIRQGSE